MAVKRESAQLPGFGVVQWWIQRQSLIQNHDEHSGRGDPDRHLKATPAHSRNTQKELVSNCFTTT